MSLIIAEIGTSHDGSLEKAYELIDAAFESGADAIKFQLVYADEILHPNTGYVKLPTGNVRLYDRFKELECNLDFYKKCRDYIHSKGKLFCCSPFGLRSLNDLLSINPDILKIASPELNHFEMLESLKEYRQNQVSKGENPIKVIISSGVSKLSDIENAIEILGRQDVSLLHCITSYPAPETEYNLSVIEGLKKIFGIDCGVSDHSLNPILVPALSVACGGTIIEKHITLSKKTSGLDDPVALEPEEFALMVHVVGQSLASIKHYGNNLGKSRIIQQLSEQFGTEKVNETLGTGIKQLAESELQNYGRTNRSLHFMKDFPAGYKIKREDIAALRTEKILSVGISPKYFDLIVGKVLTKNVSSGQGVQFEDFMTC